MSSRFWSELTHRLTPYVPGEQRNGDNIVKLNTNENPYPPSPKVLDAIAKVDGSSLRRYPDPESVDLRRALGVYHSLDEAQVFVGNGSDEILALAFMAFFTRKPDSQASAQPSTQSSTEASSALQFPTLSYSFYPVYCDLLNIPSRLVPMADDFVIDMDAFENNGGGIIFPNPNAPTSLVQPLDAIERLLSRVPDTLVLVDEAYIDFGGHSAVELINQYPNLLVSQTFSKSRSLAGMRLGVAFGNEHLVNALERVKNSFNSYPCDAVAQAAGVASLADDTYYRESIEKVVNTRDTTRDALEARGFRVLDSAANFLFVSPTKHDAGELYRWLSEKSVLVRYWDSPALKEWMRISVGTDEEMQALLNAIDESST